MYIKKLVYTISISCYKVEEEEGEQRLLCVCSYIETIGETAE